MRAFRLSELDLKPSAYRPVKPIKPVRVDRKMTARRENFPLDGPAPWLDRPDARERVARLKASGRINAERAAMFEYWIDYGYVVLESFFSHQQLDAAWAAYERSIADGRISPQEDANTIDPAAEIYPGRALNPHDKVPEIRAIWGDKGMNQIMSELLGVRTSPFQTITGHKASQQLAHSDTVHMTTYPLGYLTANWIAFEDIAPDSGPLVYYPGSHKLKYSLSREAGITLEEGRRDYVSYHQKYETMVQRHIAEHHLKAHYFNAKKGDVLIWHANLLHGGSPRQNPRSSRRALVCHYFADGCICYHDYAGNFAHTELAKLTPTPNPEATAMTKKTFDGQAYLAANEDVRLAGVDPWQHWVQFGRREGRRLRP